jgi:peroxiredoxin
MVNISVEAWFRLFSAVLCAGIVFWVGATDVIAQADDIVPYYEAESVTPLREELELKKKMFELQASADAKRIFYDALKNVDTCGVLKTAKKVGDIAPSFSLLSTTGRLVTLDSLLKKGRVVLVWYRGGWCPYCSLTLKAYQEVIDEFNELGVSVVAISPELPDRAVVTVQKKELDFTVLSDVGNVVAAAYGLVYKLTPELAKAYQNNFNLHGYNGDDTDRLPLTSTYIIGSDGVITYAFVDADYRNRAEPNEVLEILRNGAR